MLSQTAAYALRAVIHLARSAGDDPVRVEDVSESLGVPRNYLSKILHALARDGVLESTRGPGGGFRLLHPAETLRLSDVIQGFDPVEERRGCILCQGGCDDAEPCAVHHRWSEVAALMADFFDGTTVADLATPTRRARELAP